MDVLKLPINRGEANIGYSIQAVKLLHHLLADLRALDLSFAFLLEIGLDPVNALLDDIDADRPLFTGLLQAIEDLNPIEGFSPSILLNDHRERILCSLTCGKALLTFEALPPPTDRLLVFAKT